MGRVRPTYIKRVAIELVRSHPDRFTDDFDHNKAVVDELTDVDSITTVSYTHLTLPTICSV